MIKLKNFSLLCIGIGLFGLGVRGYDLGGLAHWKYYLIMFLGLCFMLWAINEEDILPGLEK